MTSQPKAPAPSLSDEPSTKSMFATTLNMLSEMQRVPIYALRRSTLAEAEHIIVQLERGLNKGGSL